MRYLVWCQIPLCFHVMIVSCYVPLILFVRTAVHSQLTHPRSDSTGRDKRLRTRCINRPIKIQYHLRDDYVRQLGLAEWANKCIPADPKVSRSPRWHYHLVHQSVLHKINLVLTVSVGWETIGIMRVVSTMRTTDKRWGLLWVCAESHLVGMEEGAIRYIFWAFLILGLAVWKYFGSGSCEMSRDCSQFDV